VSEDPANGNRFRIPRSNCRDIHARHVISKRDLTAKFHIQEKEARVSYELAHGKDLHYVRMRALTELLDSAELVFDLRDFNIAVKWNDFACKKLPLAQNRFIAGSAGPAVPCSRKVPSSIMFSDIAQQRESTLWTSP
jgi:hypothetical protein